jgi:hypothetical protein
MTIDRGLDLDNLDVVTDAEISSFRSSYKTSHGAILDAYEFWLDFDPGVVKSHRIQARYSSSEEGRSQPLHGTLGFLHLYTVMGYENGIRYEILHARSLGATKSAILQTLELAFVHSGPRGIDATRSASRGILDDCDDTGDEMSTLFPPGWAPEPGKFEFDLDMTTAALSKGELEAIQSWYVETTGEVPPHVDFLANGRPGLLKAYLYRVGRAMRGPLPAQILPFVLLQMHVARANPAGIRESALLGRGLGMTPDQLYEAAAWGTMYGGPSSLSIATDVANSVFDPSETANRHRTGGAQD